MKLLQTRRELSTRDGIMCAGAILPVEEQGGMWRVSRGCFQGALIPGYELAVVPEFTALEQENLIHREYVRALSAERDKLADRNKLLEGARDCKEKIINRRDIELKDALTSLRVTKAESERILDERDQLLEERNVLLQQIDRTLDEQKPTIPQAVADAITSFRNERWENLEIIRNAVNELNGTTPRSVAIRLYARQHINAFMIALVNSYTVEQSPEQALKSKILKTIQEWDELPEPPDYNLASGQESLAEMIADIIYEETQP